MHLRSITLKGFKSFPDRTRLEFAPGVSVIVGPNGSGKSNVTDAVLWALGEQSPLAVRGQTMQDVIFSGGHGLPSRAAAEVEVVLENSDLQLESDFAELSIKRRLERSGDGEYRLNGARCRLTDVLEVLSDSGLGKEMHSVVSQGRVEAVIHSRPRDRRLLIEEAAGLGKHRKRRRRAELKLARTTDNLSRALDVEREARSRLRPLRRQAEAADLHERLERQSVEARLELARDAEHAAALRLADAEAAASQARGERAAAESRLAAVAARREAAEKAFAAHSRAREGLSERLFAATAAIDRIDVRLERTRDAAALATAGAERARGDLRRLDEVDGALERGKASGDRSPPDQHPGAARIRALETELAALEAEHERRLESRLGALQERRGAASQRLAEAERASRERRARLSAAESGAAAVRARWREAEAAVSAARSHAARAAADLAGVERLARAAVPAPGGAESLAERLRVDPGYERAVAAVLGPLLRAAVASELEDATRLLDAAGDDGGAVILERATTSANRGDLRPAPDAVRLLEHVHPAAEIRRAVESLLDGTWVVASLDALPAAFAGVAATRDGRALFAGAGQLRQAPAGADERALERLSRREELAAAERAAAAALAEREGAEANCASAVASADAARDRADAELREVMRELDDARGTLRALEAEIADGRAGAQGGETALRRARLATELRVERAIAARAQREREERGRRAAALRAALARHEALRAAAERAEPALATAIEAVGERREAVRAQLVADVSAGERSGSELRACAHEEAEVQGMLGRTSDEVTRTEVAAQRARDAAGELHAEVERLRSALGAPAASSTAREQSRALSDDERAALEARVERLARRRDQLGAVNPLAGAEYEEAVAHVEELESQRGDLEAALAELEGIVRETDRRIRESFERTFEATARNFEEIVEHLFPGGRGRLRLVTPERPRAVIGGKGPIGDARGLAAAGDGGGHDDDVDGEAAEPASEEPGVEVEVTPAGKSMRRLSLLSGGEKSLVALAFLFAVFLARPCPFYVLDEVEAALDDLNIDRFLRLVRRCSEEAQFIVVTHQKRTMDAADRLYGISMGRDGASKVVSRRLAPAIEQVAERDAAGSEAA